MTLSEADYLARMRRATLTLKELEAKLAVAERARSEPIAIIGMACRFPGGASSPAAFWRVLDGGRDAVTRVPAERWGVDPYDRGDAATPEQHATRWGAFLTDPIDEFEPEFFGISPREAMSLDPQQRLLLEVAWEALEDAGQAPAALVGSRTGVFLGVNTNDYEQLVLPRDPTALDVYHFTGNGHCFPAGRLSYALGLQGPSLAVDTACSSSLVAMHLACQSLRNGESTMALAGGVSLMLQPWVTHLLATSQALSPDGRCKTFDAQANGYVRGEGGGVIVLKRLSDAQADGDRVLALIRGSAVNQDGRSTGLTAPNVLAQQAMLRQALDAARVAPEAISYVETHGTGTSLGDPIEIDALKQVIGAPRADGSTCVLGAVKTSVGHLEAAAGITGLIKTVLCLQHERIPANLHFKKQNPRIVLEDTALALATEARAWPRTDKPRLAGVSGFGMSGTNAHVILEEAPAEASRSEVAASARVLALSARTPESLHALAQAYTATFATPNAAASASAAALTTPDARALDDVTYTAGVKRSHFRHRLAVVGTSTAELADGVAAFVRGERPAGVATGEAAAGRKKLVFVFPGQGSQWLGMAQQLVRDQPVFRAALETCAAAIERETGWALLAELAAPKETSRLDHIDVIQPALFAIAVALAALWRSWGFEPDAVVGHSMGEVAAAHVAGALSLDDAARIICRRSRLLRTESGRGAMAAVELSLDDTRAALAGYEHRLAVAVSNGPRATVISGEPAALDEVIATLERQGVFCRRIKVDVASHSPLMDGLRPGLERALAGIIPAAPTIAMRSTVTGRPVQPGELTTTYWLDNLRQPVLFAHAIRALIDTGHELFVELSPHPILVPPVEEALRDAGTSGAAVGSLRRDQDESRVLHEAIAALYAAGANVDWARLYAQPARVVTLPTYPWHRARFWLEDSTPTTAPIAHAARTGTAAHPLLGVAIPLSVQGSVHYWEHTLSTQAAPYLADHCVQGEIVVPAAAYLETGLAAAIDVFGGKPYTLEALQFERMLSLSADSAYTFQVALTTDADRERASFQVASLQSAGWIRHASGTVFASDPTAEPTAALPLDDLRARCATPIAVDENYALLENQGLEYGPCFQGVQQLWRGAGEVLGRVRLPDEVGAQAAGYQLHPALLDACFQVLGVLLFAPDDDSTGEKETYVAVGMERVRFHRPLAREVWAHGWLQPRPEGAGRERRTGDVMMMNAAGELLAEVRGLRVQRLDGGATARPSSERWLHVPTWHRQGVLAAPATAPTSGAWLILQDRGKLGATLAQLLRARGERVVQVVRGGRRGRIEPGLYELEHASTEALGALLADAFTDDAPCRGVIHLWSLDATSDGSAASLDRAQDAGAISAMTVAQAVLQRGWRDTPKLWLVTQRAQPVGDHAIALPQATVWGLGKTLALEHPELQCVRVDLGDGSEPELRALLGELWAGDGEDQIALRADGRHVARLEKASYDDVGSEPATLRQDATYLITGGLGGLGLTVARWMVGRGARHLVVLGRSAPGEEAQAVLAELTAAGATIKAARADVADRGQLAGVLTDIATTMPPLAGVIHAAVGLEDRMLLELDAGRFHRVLAPKMHGAWNLHVLTEDKPLDFFVMYSSAAALLGSPGQAHYAAANAFLDALMYERRRRGLPGLSINWGAFAGVGQAAAQANRGERLASRGIGSMTPAQGLQVLERVLLGRAAQVGALQLDLRQWLEFYPSASGPFWSELPQDRDPKASGPVASKLRDQLAREAPAKARVLLEAELAQQMAKVLRLDPAKLDRMETFTNLGLDSLMSLELRNRIEAALGLKLSATLLFTYPNLAALAEHLMTKIAATAAPVVAAASEPAPVAVAVPADLEALGKDDLLSLFDASLHASRKRTTKRNPS